MRFLVLLLVVIGIAAVLRHLAVALLRLLKRGADEYIARQIADVRARRGDLTGLSDAQVERSIAKRARFAAVGGVSLWIGLLVVPPLTPWPELLYASYTAFWLFPRRRR
jgi:hypothetical protein